MSSTLNKTDMHLSVNLHKITSTSDLNITKAGGDVGPRRTSATTHGHKKTGADITSAPAPGSGNTLSKENEKNNHSIPDRDFSSV